MKIALIGYGKMGKEIEQVIVDEGKHEVVLKIGEENIEDFHSENLKKADVAIDFTQPEAAFENVKKCFEVNLPIVVGTTSWDTEAARTLCLEKNQTLFTSPNFSIGVNLFFKLNKLFAALMSSHKEYYLSMKEIHHLQKKDAPSGTAIKLAEDIINLNFNHSSWSLDSSLSSSDIAITALREEGVPGTHHVKYESDIDFIEIIHEAKGRRGFAVGAVRAAEFIAGKKGVFGMEDLLRL